MLMALMINFGVAAAWKIRTQGNAHYAAFRSVHVRTGESNSPPANWPRATLSNDIGDGLPTVDQLWDADPETTHAWVRGGVLGMSNVTVEGELEFDESVISGRARMERPVPLMRGALPNGRFGFDISNDLLNSRVQFHSLDLGDNEGSRARRWWDIEHTDLSALDPGIATFFEQLNTTQQRLRDDPRKIYLYPLDRDVEFWIYYQHWREFHPHTSGCSLDVNEVRLNQAQSLLRDIYRRPCRMSEAYLRLYRMWICHLESCGAEDHSIRRLRERYDDLREFVASLPMDMECEPLGELQPCEVCDPVDESCIDRNEERAGGRLNGCPAPIPDEDGLTP